MKRLAYFAVLMALGSPACARDSYSFTVGGHHIHVEASPRCRSLSCVSVSIPGVGNWHNRRDRDDDVVVERNPAPAPVPAAQVPPAPVQPAPPVQAALPVVRAERIPPAAPVQPAPVQAQPAPMIAPAVAVAPPAPVQQPPAAVEKARNQDKPAIAPPAAIPAAPPVEAPIARVSQTESEPARTPLGDWQTEGKTGLVRIEACGEALCGYLLNAMNAKGESILVNMKPKTDKEWSGNIFSRSSGNSYYGTITLKADNTLRVEACALGHFFCSGNNWSRADSSRSLKPDELVNSTVRDSHT